MRNLNLCLPSARCQNFVKYGERVGHAAGIRHDNDRSQRILAGYSAQASQRQETAAALAHGRCSYNRIIPATSAASFARLRAIGGVCVAFRVLRTELSCCFLSLLPNLRSSRFRGLHDRHQPPDKSAFQADNFAAPQSCPVALAAARAPPNW